MILRFSAFSYRDILSSINPERLITDILCDVLRCSLSYVFPFQVPPALFQTTVTEHYPQKKTLFVNKLIKLFSDETP